MSPAIEEPRINHHSHKPPKGISNFNIDHYTIVFWNHLHTPPLHNHLPPHRYTRTRHHRIFHVLNFHNFRFMVTLATVDFHPSTPVPLFFYFCYRNFCLNSKKNFKHFGIEKSML